MRRFGLGAAAALLLLAGVSRTTGTAAQARTEQIAHGAYIVTHVAMCVQCHSPRLSDGTLDTDHLLMGGQIPFKSPYSSMEFAFWTPKLAGLPAGFHEEDIVRLLTTGVDNRGRTPRPPMPPFRMTEADARAVAAYLASLPQ